MTANFLQNEVTRRLEAVREDLAALREERDALRFAIETERDRSAKLQAQVTELLDAIGTLEFAVERMFPSK